jgi:hypothetical protein
MSPKDDAVYTFLTDLKHHRKLKDKLFDMAEERPELVMAYIESLPNGWEKIEGDEKELLIRLRAKASATLRANRKK